MNKPAFSVANRLRGWWWMAPLFVVAFQVATAGAQDVELEVDPLEEPQRVDSFNGQTKVAPGAGLKPRKIGVMCAPFREDSLRGVIILEVFEGSIAEQLGLEPEDVILAVNTHPVRTPSEMSLAFATATGPIRLRVRNCRDGSIIWLRTTFRFKGGAVAAARAEESYEPQDLQEVEPGIGEDG